MLEHLYIRNYALIREIGIPFGEGFTVLTGETGAGKSVIIGALGLILGDKGSKKIFQDPEQKCIVEAQFRTDAIPLDGLFEWAGVDAENPTIVRRQLDPKGRSRAFINDTPVKLEVLKSFGEKFVDLHSQDRSRSLETAAYQLEIVDAYAGNKENLKQFHQAREKYLELKEKLDATREEAEQARLDQDYYQFQLEELDKAAVEAGEKENLEKEADTLQHAETIKKTTSRIGAMLKAADNDLVSRLKEACNELQGIEEHQDELPELRSRLESSAIELDDIAAILERIGTDTKADPERLRTINERLDRLHELMEKHRVQHSDDLIAKRNEIKEKLDRVGSMDEAVEELEKANAEQHEKLLEWAETLSQYRKKAIPELEEAINEKIGQLGMKAATFQVDRKDRDTPGPDGKDELNFNFCPAKGSRTQPLKDIASGGEKARVMLALKAAVAEKQAITTLVLDEIDTGISGNIADRAGNLMQRMATNGQLICITHSPQVAARGEQQYKVYKEASGAENSIQVKGLSHSERVEEIAMLLSGEELSDAALKNARVLLES